MGMVVRTNTMALNAYRQLGMNNSAVAKSLEKLASGYRINRAGDDAAGLAISEKMKAQITGLETASANAQDGISLIQTAEGNLGEVHDMLNRMVELSTKSANGTYTQTERDALQAEVDQLLSEIDRISQSANFNGAKLLDGTLDGVGKEVVGDASFKGKEQADIKHVLGALYKDDNEVGINTAVGRLHAESTGATKTKFAIDLAGSTYSVQTDGSQSIDDLTFEVWSKYDGTDNTKVNGLFLDKACKEEVEYSVETDSKGQISDEDLAKSIYSAITTNNADGIVYLNVSKPDDADVGTKSIQYKVSLDGSKLVFEMTDTGLEDAKAAEKDNVGIDAFRGSFAYGVATYDKDTAGNSTKVFGDTVSEVQMPAAKEIVKGSATAGAFFAETALNVTSDKVSDGAGIRVGDHYYVWGATNETVNGKYGDNVTVVDIRDLCNDKGVLAEPDANGYNLDAALSRLTVAAADNSMFHVQAKKGKDDEQYLLFTEKSTNTNTEVLTTPDGLKSQFETFTGVEADVTKVGGNGNALSLQIGDTAEAFNKMSVNIADMSTEGLNLSGLDITSEETASDAISRIKDAINTVSSTRAGLGALQNRLEHTINNLDVAAENLSAANSRIRDTDMAKEMMNYTKMNVLVQSAQAMLAQANQQPQSVLQLLQ